MMVCGGNGGAYWVGVGYFARFLGLPWFLEWVVIVVWQIIVYENYDGGTIWVSLGCHFGPFDDFGNEVDGCGVGISITQPFCEKVGPKELHIWFFSCGKW